MPVTHNEQKEQWEKEHRRPYALKQMDAKTPSSSLVPFVAFLKGQGKKNLVGLEMGCGKGRNAIWLAQQPLVKRMFGFDFSKVAIAEARKRAAEVRLSQKISFEVMDATEPWKYKDDSFDFGIDCTASVDIETAQGRQFAVDQMLGVLKPGGYFLVYVMSTDDEYHKMMIEKSPADEPHAFLHPKTGKFEKVFSEEELAAVYEKFKLIEVRRIEKTAEFFGKSYHCKLHWRVYQKT